MSRRVSVLLALATVVASVAVVLPGPVGAAPPGGEVVGGQPADPGEDPWMAALVLDERVIPNPFVGLACGASLISPDTVVTAAHCVEGARPDLVDVVVGSRDLLPGTVERLPVRTIRRHPRWDPARARYDVAVIQLRRAASAPVTPIDLVAPGEEALWAPGTTARVTGWGMDELQQPISRLQEGEAPLVADGDCADRLGELFHAPSMLCFGDLGPTGGDVSPCFGDSGGPLTVLDGSRRVLVGIVSGGLRCGDPNYPAIFAEVAAARAFLEPYLDPDDVPQRVRDLRAQRRGSAERRLAVWWRPPAFDGGTRLLRYSVLVQPGNRRIDLPPGQRSVTVRDAPTGRPLQVTVTAHNALGAGPAARVTVP